MGYLLPVLQGSQSWKYLNNKNEYTGLSWKVLENKICLEKYLKNIQRPWKVLEFYHLQEDLTLFFEGLNQYKLVEPLFGAAYAAPNKGTTFLHWFSKTNVFSNGIQHFRSRILTCKSVFFISFQSLKTVGKSSRSPWKVLEFYMNLPVWTLFSCPTTSRLLQDSWRFVQLSHEELHASETWPLTKPIFQLLQPNDRARSAISSQRMWHNKVKIASGKALAWGLWGKEGFTGLYMWSVLVMQSEHM